MSQTVTIDDITLHLSHPDELRLEWVGQQELMDQVLAAWMVVDPHDLPLNPRLIGKPGVGKTTLAYAAAKQLNRDVYLFQATMDTRPEDLLVTPVIAESNRIQYVASPIVTAMIRGGVAILDEGNRMSEKSWASLAPLLDSRRYVESIVAGVKIRAHPNFRVCATMNDDASTFELPEYIHSRLQPQILIDFPEREEERLILARNLPFADERILAYVVDFLQQSHIAQERYTVRDGINIGRYAIKLLSGQRKVAWPRSTPPSPKLAHQCLEQAISLILGSEARDYLPPPPPE
jgi:MoxR-like ATPase